MISIKTKIVSSLLILILVMVGLMTTLILINNNLLNRYKEINSNIVYEQALKDAIWDMVEDCYNDFKTGDFTNYENDLKTISELQTILDTKTKSNKDTYAAYIGLKNSLTAVIDDVAVAKSTWESSGGTEGSTSFFETAGKKFEIVKTSTTGLIFAEVQNIATVSKDIQRIQSTLNIFTIILSVSITLLAIIYSLYFSKKITDPLVSLSMITKDIAAGNLSLSVDSKILNLKDEIGTLANSFNLMLQSLKKELTSLVEERDKSNAIITSMGDGLYVLDKDDRIVILNKEAASIIGDKDQDLIGKKISEVIKVYRKNSLLLDKEQPMSASINDDIYYELVKSKKKIPVKYIETSLFDENKEVSGKVVAFDDVTIEKQNMQIIEQKVVERTLQYKQEKAKLSASIENMPLGFLMTDISGRLLVINSLAKNILGSSDGDKSFEKLQEIVKDKIDLIDYIRNCNGTTQSQNFKDFSLPNGRFLRIIISPIIVEGENSENNCVGVVILVEDVTEAKVIERSKDEFFSIASYELRTPLTAIRGNMSIIQDHYTDQMKDTDFSELILDTEEASLRLIGIVNDFLDLSRLEQGKMQYKMEKVNLKDLVNSVSKELESVIEEKHIEYQSDIDKDMTVTADSNKLKQVFFNIIGNSIKFTENGKIVISAKYADDFIEVIVSDTGSGIPIATQPLLFHKFQQAGSSILTRDATKGTGLGLYISRLLIEAMKGKLELVTSKEGQGTIFKVTIKI